MMWIFDKVKPLKIRLISSWIADQLDLTHRRDSSNNMHPIFGNIYKDALSDVSLKVNKCIIPLLCLNFPIFSSYMVSQNKKQSNIGKSKRCVFQPVKDEEDGDGG